MTGYMAPLEGITTYIYRAAYHHHFRPMDKYFTPFISPAQKRPLRTRETRDVCPENNEGLPVIPQILTNDVALFLDTCRELEALGYTEVNLNIGCPSGTVTARGKGAGFLKDPEELDRFLEQICQGSSLRISVKTRLGWADPEEFYELLPVLNRYPLTEVILHPRVRQEYYRGKPHREAFAEALKESVHPLFYNGNLFSTRDITEIFGQFPETAGVMLGRGLIADPSLWERYSQTEAEKAATEVSPSTISSEEKLKDRIRSFHDEIYEAYRRDLSGDAPVIHKMKELWFYMVQLFSRDPKVEKALRKVQHRDEYERWAGQLFRQNDLDFSGFVPPAGWQEKGSK